MYPSRSIPMICGIGDKVHDLVQITGHNIVSVTVHKLEARVVPGPGHIQDTVSQSLTTMIVSKKVEYATGY